MAKRDYYNILGVSKESSAAEIKKSYRKLALKYHPDRNPDNKQAEDKFKEAAEAYDILSNPEKRKKYDQLGHAGMNQSGGQAGFSDINDIFDNFSDIFGDLFGGRKKKKTVGSPIPKRGHDLAKQIDISLKDSYTGCSIDLNIYHYTSCNSCQGSGCKSGTKASACSTCNGYGEVSYQQGFFAFSQPCSDCRGEGFTILSPCQTCSGQSRIQQYEKIDGIKIPAGVYDGAELRLSGKGDAGIYGGSSGDLYIKISVSPEKHFYRKNNDLVTRLSLTYPQLVFGCQVEITNINGSKETIKIPRGTPVGEEIKLIGKGFPDIRNKVKGNLIVITECDIPKKLDNETKQSLKDYAERLGNQSQDSNGISGFFKKFLG